MAGLDLLDQSALLLTRPRKKRNLREEPVLLLLRRRSSKLTRNQEEDNVGPCERFRFLLLAAPRLHTHWPQYQAQAQGPAFVCFASNQLSLVLNYIIKMYITCLKGCHLFYGSNKTVKIFICYIHVLFIYLFCNNSSVFSFLGIHSHSYFLL